MKFLLKSTLLPIIMLLFSTCDSRMKADLMIYNAHIQSVDAGMRQFDAMVVNDGVIVALGERESLERTYLAKETKDLENQYVYPGFYDAHCHFYGLGMMNLQYADLNNTGSFEEIVERMKQHAKSLPKDEWILGRGWDQNDWDNNKMPVNDLLNAQFPDRPVLLIRVDGHAVMANDFLLHMAGFDKSTHIEGGELLLHNDKLSGVLLDNAGDALKALIPEPTDKMVKQALLFAQDECLKYGLTSVTDAGLTSRYIHLIKEMIDAGELKMRFDVMLSNDQATLDEWMTQGVYQSDHLRIGSVKIYADGALGSRGACLIEEYNDHPGNHGIMIQNKGEMDSICRKALQYGFQVNTHAIGDSAARMVLQVYAQHLLSENDKRWRIEHAQTIHPDDFEYFGKYNIIPAVNTTHATSDMYWAENRLGKERMKSAYAYQKLLLQNGWCTNGSDFPIEGVNPVDGFFAAVYRTDSEGYPKGGFQMENAWSREDALRAMTIWAAKGSFMEQQIGSLEVGKKADFVVFEGNLLDANCNILQKQVLSTYIDGKEVYTFFPK